MLSAVNAYFFDIFYHFFAIFQNEMGFIPGDFLDTLRCEIPNSHIYRFNGALYVSDISFLQHCMCCTSLHWNNFYVFHTVVSVMSVVSTAVS